MCSVTTKNSDSDERSYQIDILSCPKERSDLDDDEALVNENENTSCSLRAHDKNSKDVEGSISEYSTSLHT